MILLLRRPEVVERLDFERGRVRPSLATNAALGRDVYKSGNLILRLQVQGQNLNDPLNVLDFQGLFSGNAISPSRRCFARLTVEEEGAGIAAAGGRRTAPTESREGLPSRNGRAGSPGE